MTIGLETMFQNTDTERRKLLYPLIRQFRDLRRLYWEKEHNRFWFHPTIWYNMDTNVMPH